MDEKLMNKVIELEWEMFSAVQNTGRRAACQMNKEAFTVIRRSQECEWPEELLASYHEDLAAAGSQGRNLMSEKYAWMMESTFPDEFRRIAHLLPPVDPAAAAGIEEIVAVNVDWKLELGRRYPKLARRGRPIRSGEDSHYDTSFETYLRGELKTYSPETIAALRAFTARQKAAGINGAEKELLNQVRHYGFSTLEHAEEHQ